MGEQFACRDCKQIIIFHEGRNLVVNFYDGQGGARGARHLCPHRMGSDPHHKESHKKMMTSFPKGKAIVIICPEPECNYPCVEINKEKPLADLFIDHIQMSHGFNPTRYFIDNLRGKIDYCRHNGYYRDKFIAVSWDELFKTSYTDQLKK